MLVEHLPELLSLGPPPFIHVHDPLGHLEYYGLNEGFESGTSLFVSIDAIECISTRIFYTRIINGLASWAPSWDHWCECWGGQENGTWDRSWDAFLQALKALYKSLLADKRLGPEESVVILVRNADRLEASLPNIFVPLTRLSELSLLNTTTIFVSRCTWFDMRPARGVAPDPLLVTVPPITPVRTKEYLASLYPDRPPSLLFDVYTHRLKPLYSKYVDLVHTVCAEITSDPKHLAYIASAHWPGFVAPVVQEWRALHQERQRASIPENDSNQGSASHSAPTGDSDHEELSEELPDDLDALYPLPTNDDFHRLSKRSNKALISALHTLYPRLMGAKQWAELNAPPKTLRLSDRLAFSQSTTASPSKHRRIEEESSLNNLAERLTWRVKLMLIASYLASSNPPKADVKIFGRATDGTLARRKKGGGFRKSPTKTKGTTAGASSKLPRHLTGPSPFPLDRFKAIFEALLLEHSGDQGDEEAWSSTEVTRVQVLTCMSELVQMQLLQRASLGSEDKLDGSTTFKSNVSLELAQKIAQELKIDLASYLWEVVV